jgi:hypothetical protein
LADVLRPRLQQICVLAAQDRAEAQGSAAAARNNATGQADRSSKGRVAEAASVMMTLKGLLKNTAKTAGVVTLKNNLFVYARLGIVANRMWAPTAMLRLAENITGNRYNAHKLEAYYEAIRDLETWINQHGGTYR